MLLLLFVNVSIILLNLIVDDVRVQSQNSFMQRIKEIGHLSYKDKSLQYKHIYIIPKSLNVGENIQFFLYQFKLYFD
jgi:hypothetical protein